MSNLLQNASNHYQSWTMHRIIHRAQFPTHFNVPTLPLVYYEAHTQFSIPPGILNWVTYSQEFNGFLGLLVGAKRTQWLRVRCQKDQLRRVRYQKDLAAREMPKREGRPEKWERKVFPAVMIAEPSRSISE